MSIDREQLAAATSAIIERAPDEENGITDWWMDICADIYHVARIRVCDANVPHVTAAGRARKMLRDEYGFRLFKPQHVTDGLVFVDIKPPSAK